MKNIFKKTISGIECILLVLSMVATILISYTNTANAAPSAYELNEITTKKQYVNTLKRASEHSLITGKTIIYPDDMKIFVDKNLVVNKGAYTSEENIASKIQYVYIDDGATFNVVLYDNPEKNKVTEDDWYTELWVNDQKIKGPISTIADIRVQWDEIKQYDGATSPTIDLKVYKSNGERFWHGDSAKSNIIGLKINNNHILLGKANENISSDFKECSNAVIKNNTLYIKPGTSIYLSNEWKEYRSAVSEEKSTGTGTYSCDNNTNFYLSGNALSAGTTLGAQRNN